MITDEIERSANALRIALSVIDRGWNPIPVPIGKNPNRKDWQKLRITRENAPNYFNGAKLNVGAQMGPVSKGLTDVDLDCVEAIALAPYFLPKTGAIYGRPSKRCSHYLYYGSDPEPKASIIIRDEEKAVIVELRMGGGGKGAQSIMPGSVHPSGEVYAWDVEGEPAQGSCADLKAAIKKIAVAVVLLRHWPAKGGLHDCALGVAGFLTRAGWNQNETTHLIWAICQCLGEGQGAKDKVRALAHDSITRLAKGEEVRGLPWLQECFGRDVADNLAKLVGYFQQEAAPIGEEGSEGVSLKDFYAYMPMHDYIFAPTREMWPASSVDARFPPVIIGLDEDGKDITIKASRWLDQNRPVEQLTWAPGKAMIIEDFLISDGGWIARKGVHLFNQYRPAKIELGDANAATPWIGLVRTVFPNDADHIIKYFAQRVQQPDVKINHALVLGSQEHGIGKDTILEGVKRAVGPWNFKDISPAAMFETFNPWVRGVILRINEVKDMGDVTRFEFYERSKNYLAAPPDTLHCNEKNIKQHYVLNCMGVVVTTNHLTDGLYLPAEDRRHYVAWSDCKQSDFTKEFWDGYWAWFDGGGDRHVAAYLTTLDISDFNPKAPPPKTPAFWSIVNANRTSEESELADALDDLGARDGDAVVRPDAVTLGMLAGRADLKLTEWLEDRKNRKAVNHRLEACGYRAVTNPTAKDGYWRINDRRQVVYAKVTLSEGQQREAAEALQREAAEEVIRREAEAEAERLRQEEKMAASQAEYKAMMKRIQAEDRKRAAEARKAAKVKKGDASADPKVGAGKKARPATKPPPARRPIKF